jgi:beta-glucosidase
MKFMKNKLIGLAVSCVLATSARAAGVIKLTNEASIDSVIKEMTLDEKAKLVNGIGMGFGDLVASPRVTGAVGATYAIPRLGIPEMVVSDGPAGLRLGGVGSGVEAKLCTAFPIPTAVASTWDVDSINRIGQIMGRETKEYGVDFILGPALNIQRDPLGGRNFEYFSEDPYLSGKIAAAMTNGIQSQGVGATIKHFAVNNFERYRFTTNITVGERALREIYLNGFEIAVKESKPWSVMSSYPLINGEHGAENPSLLTDILRRQWGFDGLVMSDWYAVNNQTKAMNAGNDLDMPGGMNWFTGKDEAEMMLDAVTKGEIDETVLDRNIKNILKVMLKSPVFNGVKALDKVDSSKDIPFIRKIAAEGMVLLKNKESVLPFTNAKVVGLFGKGALDFIIGGGGSSQVNSAYSVQLTEGFKNGGYKYINTLGENKLIEGIDKKSINNVVKKSDIAVISLGKFSSENSDKFSMNFFDEEIALIKNVASAYHNAGKKVVVLLNVGAPVEIQSWAESADAILLTWQPGQEAGNAIVDVISGKVNPSGKLTETFPARYNDNPSFGNNIPVNNEIMYGEGIYVGYRYYDTKKLTPAYAFGHGLSYTEFEYSNIKISSNIFNLEIKDKITVTADIQNTGKVKGKEIVQMYITDPASIIDKPLQELKGFTKVELSPGEKKSVSFEVNKRDLSYYDTSKKDWNAETGKYIVKVASSSRDANSLTAIFTAIGKKEITLATPWDAVQSYSKAAEIIAKYIGEKNVNTWAIDNPDHTLKGTLQFYLSSMPEYKNNSKNLNKTLESIVKEINEL